MACPPHPTPALSPWRAHGVRTLWVRTLWVRLPPLWGRRSHLPTAIPIGCVPYGYVPYGYACRPCDAHGVPHGYVPYGYVPHGHVPYGYACRPCDAHGVPFGGAARQHTPAAAHALLVQVIERFKTRAHPDRLNKIRQEFLQYMRKHDENAFVWGRGLLIFSNYRFAAQGLVGLEDPHIPSRTLPTLEAHVNDTVRWKVKKVQGDPVRAAKTVLDVTKTLMENLGSPELEIALALCLHKEMHVGGKCLPPTPPLHTHTHAPVQQVLKQSTRTSGPTSS